MSLFGLDYLTSNEYTAFPFNEDAIGLAYTPNVIAHGSSATLPVNFLVDALLYVPADTGLVYLSSIVYDSGDWLLIFKNEVNMTIAIFTYSTTSERVLSLQSSLPNPGVTLRLIKGSAFDSHLATITNMDAYGKRLQLSEACVESRANKLDGICIRYAEGSVSPVLTGPITLLEGHNIALVTEGNKLSIAAVPGVGAGKAPCVEVPRRVKGTLTPAADGSVFIVGDSCYDVILESNMLRITGACYACCSCTDYVNTMKATQLLLDRAAALKSQLFNEENLDDVNTIYGWYNWALEQYNETAVPNRRRVIISLRPVAGSQTTKGAVVKSTHGVISIALANMSLSPIENVTITMSAKDDAGVEMEQVGYGGSYNAYHNGSVTTADIAFPLVNTPLPDISVGEGVSILVRAKAKEAGNYPAELTDCVLHYTQDGEPKELIIPGRAI